ATIMNEVRAEWEGELNRRLEEARAANTQLPGHDDSEVEDEEMDGNASTMQRIGDILEGQKDLMTMMVNRQSSGPTELRVEGINMPQYKGQVGENLDLFMWNVKVFFAAKNLDADAPGNQKRCMAMIVASLRGVAGSWYQDYVTRTGVPPSNLLQLETLLRAEFVPTDLQERLRDKLAGLSQKSCVSLEEYISRYREVMVQVRDMSELDKVMWFNRGLRSKTKIEVNYRRCTTVSQAMAVALEFERTHFGGEARGGSSHLTQPAKWLWSKKSILSTNEMDLVVIPAIQAIQGMAQATVVDPNFSTTWRNGMDYVSAAIQPSTSQPSALSQNEACAQVTQVNAVQLAEAGVPKRSDDGSMVSRAQWLRMLSEDTPVRWVLDYHYVNSQQEIPKIPLPNIDELFDSCYGACVFTKINLNSGYHQMLVAPRARKYTAFRTHRETYEWCVAPMGMAGMPGLWSRLMRAIFQKYPFIKVYMDDLCICSRSMEEHVVHLRVVFELFREQKLYARKSKCEFGVSEVRFLGHVISKDGLAVDPCKIEVIEKWQPPASRKELLSFLGLAGYYRKFIFNYAAIVLPLSELTKDSVEWLWMDEQQDAFETIKLHLQQAPVLQFPDHDKPFIVTTDASDLCCGAVLSQMDGVGDEHPIAFMSKKLGVHEKNWPAHEKELFAIKLALTKWRHYLLGQHFDVYTDNSACQWFLKTPVLNSKMARWLDFFSEFDFALHHRPGSTNVVADALSRHDPVGVTDYATGVVSTVTAQVGEWDRSLIGATNAPTGFLHGCDMACLCRVSIVAALRRQSDVLSGLPLADKALFLGNPYGGERSLAQDSDWSWVRVPEKSWVRVPSEPRIRVGVPQQHVINHAQQLDYTMVGMSDTFKERLRKAYEKDPAFQRYANGRSNYAQRDGLYFFKSKHRVWRLQVPADDVIRTEIISMFHDSPSAAHPGVRRTQLAVAQWYVWPSMNEDIHLYVVTCETCQRYKSSSRKSNGLLMPLPIPPSCWHTVTMDFITGLPVSDGYDSILVVVCKLSKRPKYIPTHTTVTA
ncbi:hypothetical protein As57867_024696, partial [Aphanomyces stellatus]